jgi:hypothetical protein
MIMTEIVYIAEPTEDSPKVRLDSETGVLMFTGTSIPENSEEFYGPVLNWLDDFINMNPESIDINFKLDYFNTSSSKYILEILRTIERVSGTSKIVVKWHYLTDDDDMKEAGEDYQIMVKLPFEMVEYDD